MSRYHRHAQIADVPENLHAIVALEHSLWTGPIACPPAPPDVPRAVEAPWVSNECFDMLGFAPGERTRFHGGAPFPIARCRSRSMPSVTATIAPLGPMSSM